MSIKMQGETCEAKFTAPDEYAGRSAKCVKCDAPITIPAAPPPIASKPVRRRPVAAYAITVPVVCLTAGLAIGFLLGKAVSQDRTPVVAASAAPETTKAKRLETELRASLENLAAAESIAAKAEEKWKQWAITEAHQYADQKLQEFFAEQQRSRSDEELAVQLARMNQAERGRFGTALAALRQGDKLRPSQIEIIERVPAVYEEFAAAMVKQERQREFSELLSPEKPHDQPNE